MKLEEIEIIRIALDTEETHKDFVKNITEAKIILNKEEKAINYSQCCKSDSELLACDLYDNLGCAISGNNNENCFRCKYSRKAN